MLGVEDIKAFIVEVKSVVLKRTKVKSYWGSRAWPRVREPSQANITAALSGCGGTWCCEITQPPRRKHLPFCPLLRVSIATSKKKKWLPYPHHPLKTHLDYPNPLFLFTEYLLRNPGCGPGTVLGTLKLLFPLPGMPVGQISTWLATLSLSSFKTFIPRSCSQGCLSWPGSWELHSIHSIHSPKPSYSLSLLFPSTDHLWICYKFYLFVLFIYSEEKVSIIKFFCFP